MNVIYVLWLREVKRYLRSRAQIIASLGQPLLYLLVLGFGFGAVFQQAGPGQLPAVRRARRDRDGRSSSRRSSPASACCGTGSSASSRRRSSRPCRACRSWSGRTLGGATIAMIQGMLVLVVCLIAGFRPESWAAVPLALLFMALIADRVLGARHGDRVDAARHAGLPADHELPGHADLLPVRRAVPARRTCRRRSPSRRGSTRCRTASTGCARAFIGVSHIGVLLDVSVLAVLCGAVPRARRVGVLEDPGLS